ncbi:MAG: hypothetical protein ACXV8O_12565 [Methylobacter sp.]
MKINNLTNGLVATLLLVSPIVGAETEYPASDFKPKVIYQDAEYSSQGKSTASTAPAKQEKSVEVDSKYPAADFEPKVLYKDADYKPSKSAVTSSTSERTSSIAGEAEISAPVKAEDSMMTYLLGLIAFAVAGYVFLAKREPKAKVSEAPVYSSHVSGLSGVARYLRKHNMVAATGVARYLESRVSSEKEKTAVSGVEKYLEKQAKSAKEIAAQAGTGVEKYMRNRG